MPEVPVLLRGKFYNTSKVFRCPNFSRCEVCNKCQNHQDNNYMCQQCEKAFNYEYLCGHNDEQQVKALRVLKMFNRPFSHVDDLPPPITEGLEEVEAQIKDHEEDQESKKFLKIV